MTPDKAIEILSDSAYRGVTTHDQDFKDAEMLGIEALKEVICLRSTDRTLVRPLLPGETED